MTSSTDRGVLAGGCFWGMQDLIRKYERLWRSIKYEEVYLHAYASVSEGRAGLTRYLTQYNTARPHSSLADRTP